MIKIEPQLLCGKNVMIAAHGNSLRSIIMYLDELTSQEVGIWTCWMFLPFSSTYNWTVCVFPFVRLLAWSYRLGYRCFTFLKRENLFEEAALWRQMKQAFMLTLRCVGFSETTIWKESVKRFFGLYLSYVDLDKQINLLQFQCILYQFLQFTIPFSIQFIFAEVGSIQAKVGREVSILDWRYEKIYGSSTLELFSLNSKAVLSFAAACLPFGFY